MGTVAKKIMMGSGAVALPSDDEFNRVSFLSHFDGANNGVNDTFDDSSASNHTITTNGDGSGNVTQGSFGPFARPDGEWGWNFDGSGDYLTIADSTDFDCGTGDFCLELFIFSGGASSNPLLVTFGGGFYLQLKDSMTDISFYTGSTEIVYSGNASLTDDAWHHIAITREGSSLRHFLDGSLVKTTSNSDAVNSSATVYVGINNNGSTLAWTGFISNLRLVNGSAVYTSAFTVPTSKLTAITNTKLLTCQSNRFVDNSASAHTVTPSGNAAVTAFGPFLTSAVYNAAVNGASAYFDGTDRLTASANADFAMGTEVFTISAWVYQTGTNNNDQVICSLRSSGSSSTGLIFNISMQTALTGRLIFFTGGTGYYGPDASIKINQWNHLVCVRDANNVIRSYVNGVPATMGTFTNNFSENTFQSGAESGLYSNNGMIGYITDLRILKGTALYGSSAFTPPTAPLTAITNTKLLLNMADGQAIDSAAQHNLSLENGTNISTAQAKFGDSSIFFDGTTDTATVIGSENVNFGTDNFTVEGWIRPASFSGYKPNIISKWTNGSRGWAVRLVASGSGFKMRFTFSTDGSNDASLDATTVLAFDTWHFFAFVQNSNTVTCYVNGTANGTKSVSTIFASTNPLILGDWDTNAGDYNGYMDDMRVTTGFARYTSNFTAPTKAFPDKGQ